MELKREVIEDIKSRCDLMGVEFKIEDFDIEFSGQKIILKRYTGNETELFLNDAFDEVSVNSFMNSKLEFIDLGITKHISNLAFNNSYYLKRVIGKKVNYIGVEAFKNCFSLECVEFLKLKEIDTNAFSYCNKLKSIIGMDKVIKIHDGAFSNCDSLETISLNSLTYLGRKAFIHCTSLKNIGLESLTVLSKRVFSYCYNLEEIYIPNVIEIKPCAITGCIKLHTIYLKNLNMNLSTQDGLISLKKVFVNNDLELIKNTEDYKLLSLKGSISIEEFNNDGE